MADANDDFLDAKGVLRFKGWSRSTLQKYVKIGVIKKYKVNGMRGRYRKSELTEAAMIARGLEKSNA